MVSKLQSRPKILATQVRVAVGIRRRPEILVKVAVGIRRRPEILVKVAVGIRRRPEILVKAAAGIRRHRHRDNWQAVMTTMLGCLSPNEHFRNRVGGRR